MTQPSLFAHATIRPGSRYRAHELFDDLNSGHEICVTAYIQNRAMAWAGGPAALAAATYGLEVPA